MIPDLTSPINSIMRSSLELNNFEKQLDRDLQSEQLDAIKSIAESAESQAFAANKEVEILKKQLHLAQKEAADAKKDAMFSKVMAILAFAVSICAVIAPLIFG
ncbi:MULTISPECIES: hypothetical protein [Eisenbergiella]|uniref:Uncharacterized protein n=1 Tax=Eisenbergiella porci TaxID=2652274 RepID=A0A6N7WA08_9FIRM|nr:MULTISPECIES: hypothetical protein [Eisenbergiella]MCI6707912.1 hypothetical protein [Eisenbergiella massiliensis]MDY5529308.1 hypothetical protein [Eisenbergiella porci]MSS92101.1 hypothetical protein [Eisenbergiella porci]